jgi:beta-lactamase regulating signal transducer with metallopeptidase domain
MDFLLRCLVLSCAALGAAALLGAALQTALWRVYRPSGAASDRADALLRLRLLPAALSGFALVFAAIGLMRFESRGDHEVVGLVIQALAVLGAAMALDVFVRLARQQWSTHRIVRTWMATASPVRLDAVCDAHLPVFAITTGFPVVAVIGALRPRIVIDRLVLEGCAPEELTAILAHEQGHVRRWDNARRLLFAAVPGDRLTPGLARSWRDATEEAADDAAVAAGGATHLNLASALVRVARMAKQQQWDAMPLPASALYRGDDIEGRVRRLVDTTEAPCRAQRGWGTTLAAVGITMAFLAQQSIHDVMELLVATLP